MSNDDPEKEKDDMPSTEEKEILRYYYYIKYGADTIHCSPMHKTILRRFN